MQSIHIFPVSSQLIRIALDFERIRNFLAKINLYNYSCQQLVDQNCFRLQTNQELSGKNQSIQLFLSAVSCQNRFRLWTNQELSDQNQFIHIFPASSQLIRIALGCERIRNFLTKISLYNYSCQQLVDQNCYRL